jgi:hypothetical protein
MNLGLVALVLLGLAAIGLLAQWGAHQLDDSGNGHWLVRAIWGVLVVVAFVLLNFVVPAGQEEWERQIDDKYTRCEFDLYPDCPGYRDYGDY